jgi:tetratricopeptide (TPR) repeat protein
MQAADKRRQQRAEKRKRRRSKKAPLASRPVPTPGAEPSTAPETSGAVQMVNLAMEHHRSGRLGRAEELYRRILKAEPNHPDGLHLLGVLAYQAGDNQTAIDLIEQAIAVHPVFPEAHNNLGMALYALGRFDEAVACYQIACETQAEFGSAHYNLGNAFRALQRHCDAVTSYDATLAINANNAEAHNNRAAALADLGEHEKAIAGYRKAVALNPDSGESQINLGNTLRIIDRNQEAAGCYQKALAIEPHNVEALSGLAHVLTKLGAQKEAAACYRKVLTIEADNLEALNNRGNALRCLGKLSEASASFRRALEIDPDNHAANTNLGSVLKDQKKYAEAEAHYRKALAIEPSSADAHDNLCELLEKTNRTDALREAVREVERHCPGDHRLPFRQAQSLKRDRDYAAARAVLEQPVADPDKMPADLASGRLHLLGDLCDRLGDTEAAFDYFQQGNRIFRESDRLNGVDKGRHSAEIDSLAQRFSFDWVTRWTERPVAQTTPELVFLGGFPRSGTTLLDTILEAHPAIGVTEEEPMVSVMRRALDVLPGSVPDNLANLSAADFVELRRIYFEVLDAHIDPAAGHTVVVDKLPLHTVQAGLIHRVFPEARFVFALRHPCDCVLSCFMQHFTANHAMANFLDIEDAARLYDKVMNLWQQYRAILPLQVHTVRYESLVERYEETVRPLLDFMGVGWDDSVLDHVSAAHRRGRIMTTSYDQVSQPIYTRARGRWENYREQMAPVLPILLPWAQRYGYGVDESAAS